MTVQERFWGKVQKTDGCWEWQGAIQGHGYGHFWDGHKDVSAHRWSYEQSLGSVPNGLELDHLCRNRACVRPSHLEAVTHHDNLLRGEGIVALYAHATHCLQGHPYDLINTRVTNRGRLCLTCKKNRQHIYKQKRGQR